MKATVSSFFSGVGLLFRGIGMYARSPRLLLLGLIPAVIAMLVFAAALGTMIYFLDDLSVLVTWYADDWSTTARQAMRLTAGVGLVGVGLLIWILTFTAVTLLIGDPFYEAISEKVEDGFGGVPDAVDLPWWRSMFRSLKDALRMLAISLLIGVPLFAAGFIPVVGQTVVPVLGALVGGWFLAVELVGVAFNRRGLRLKDRRRALAGHRALAVGFGAGVFVCFLIPLGAVLIMPAAVAGGTLLARRSLSLPIERPTP
ncbi:CysZ protein [Allocatelliglobosispora scoriae]|uniref:CysZ protein n=1 Tax=Allocatelliglobosispora scoriae TaxID=643052 RepID=A0A841BTS3_9ACTN|nr:EI24 domain-containing protein [Allocatelliglobosispora scoriae]MBB5870559.1 CysZ protein [Allocatelliglobosispora scoriae]